MRVPILLLAGLVALAGCDSILGIQGHPLAADDGDGGTGSSSGADATTGDASGSSSGADSGSGSGADSGSSGADSGSSGGTDSGSDSGADSGSGSGADSGSGSGADSGSGSGADSGSNDGGDGGGCTPGTQRYCAASGSCISALACCTSADCTVPGQTCPAPGGSCACPPATWNMLSDTSKWTTFDVSTVNAAATGFQTAAFDGRYVYLVPYSNGANDGIVARYDTTAAFGASGSWATFDISTLNAAAQGFIGAVFDGRYLYLVPDHDNAGADGIVARYDTTAAFGATGSWTTFDVSTVTAGAKGFFGAAFDGRYAYLVPWTNGAIDGIVARYDTTAPFGTSGSWTTFDVSTVNAGSKGFMGAAFDGRYLYLVPYYNGAFDGVVTRYDTRASFSASSSWTTFDVATVNARATAFEGATFDGRYVYFVPSANGASGTIARYDTTAAFGSSGSWTTFDLTTITAGAEGFASAAFDGRYVYLVPDYDGAYDGILAQYDTTLPFGASSSWTMFDVSTVNGRAKGFIGSAFDGRYVYLVPSYDATSTPDGLVARFDAKSPACLPTGWNASFF